MNISSKAYLMLLELPVDDVGRLFMGLLNGYVFSEREFCPMQPGSNYSQGTWERLIQMNMPVQKLQNRASRALKGMRCF